MKIFFLLPLLSLFFLVACSRDQQAAVKFKNSITHAPHINLVNQSDYGARGVCSFNGQNIELIIGELVTVSLPCEDGQWALENFDASTFLDNDTLVLEAIEFNLLGAVFKRSQVTLIKDTVPPALTLGTTSLITAQNHQNYLLQGGCGDTHGAVVITISNIDLAVFCEATVWSIEVNLENLPQALTSVDVVLSSHDRAGNPGELSVSLNRNLSATPTAPSGQAVAITSSLAINASSPDPYPIEGTCTNNAEMVSLSITNTNITKEASCQGGQWQVNIPHAELDEGSIPFEVTHQSASAQGSLSKDTQPPTLAFTTPLEGINLANQASYPLSGTCSQEDADRVVGLVLGGVLTLSTSGSCGADGTWSATLDILSLSIADKQGISIAASLSDTAGNETVTTATMNKDTVAPTAVTLDAPQAGGQDNEKNYPLLGTCSDPTGLLTVEVGALSKTGIVCQSNRRWETSLDITSLGGTISIVVIHSDEVGNMVRAQGQFFKENITRTFSVQRLGVSDGAASCVVGMEGDVLCWGKGEILGQNESYYAIGGGAARYSNKAYPVAVVAGDGSSLPLKGVSQVSAGRQSICALTIEGRVLCWGKSDGGQLGDGTTADLRDYPAPVLTMADGPALVDVVQLVAKNKSYCALTRVGRVWCWGGSFLGNNASGGSDYPVSVVELATGGTESILENIVQIASSATSDHGCALTATGQVKCWGIGNYGQLGDADGAYDPNEGFIVYNNKNYAVTVLSTADDSATVDTDESAPLGGITQIALGSYTSCGLSAENHIKCWGFGHNGFLAQGSNPLPVTVNDGEGSPVTGVSQLALGRQHGCFVTTSNELKCWGANAELPNNNAGGAGSVSGQNIPNLAVDPGDFSSFFRNALEVAVSDSHSCVLQTTGKVYCWGQNSYSGHSGFLGGANEDRRYPSRVVAGEAATSQLNVGSFQGSYACSVGGGRCVINPVGLSFAEGTVSPNATNASAHINILNLHEGQTLRLYKDEGCRELLATAVYPTSRVDAGVLGKGVHSIRFTLQDIALNNLVSTCSSSFISYVVDQTLPALVGEAILPRNKTYHAGEHLDFIVKFDEDVTIQLGQNPPEFPLQVGSRTAYAKYMSYAPSEGNSGPSRGLVFRYTVEEGDIDSDGIALVGNVITLNEAVIEDEVGNAIPSIAGATLSGLAVGDLAMVQVDGQIPTITTVTAAGGNYGSGDAISITVTFSRAVEISGSVALELQVGGEVVTAVYAGNGQSSTTHSFTYTVGTGDGSVGDDLQMKGIDLAGGSIVDSVGNSIKVEFAPVTVASSGGGDILVANNPVIRSIQIAQEHYGLGDNLEIEIIYSQPITVVEVSGKKVRIGMAFNSPSGTTRYAEYHSGSGGNQLIFRYTVVAGDNDNNGITLTTTIDLNSGSMKSTATPAKDAPRDFSSFTLPTVNIDSVVPTLAITAPTNSIDLSNTYSYALAGTCSESGSVVILLNGIERNETASCDGTAWSTNVNTAGIAQGSVAITAYLEDMAGNRGTASAVTTTKALPSKSFKLSKIAGGKNHTCVIIPSGQVQCWGSGSHGQLGNGATDHSPSPVTVSNLEGVVHVSSNQGANHTCALKSNGQVACWGKMDRYQLGHGSNYPAITLTPVTVVTDQSGEPLKNIVQLSLGSAHSCALNTQGAVLCWGRIPTGDSNTEYRTTTARFPRAERRDASNSLDRAINIASGAEHMCIINHDQSGACWGRGTDSRLGLGADRDPYSPASLPYPETIVSSKGGSAIGDIAQLSPGGSFTCALFNSGGIKCWGRYYDGQFGNSDGNPINGTHGPSPQTVSNISQGTALASSGGSSCALVPNGELQCWGHGANGRLGDSSNGVNFRPNYVNAENGQNRLGGITEFTLGDTHVCALNQLGYVYCWGKGTSGETGHGEMIDRNYPLQVVGTNGSPPYLNVGAFSASYECIQGGDSCRLNPAKLMGPASPSSEDAIMLQILGLDTKILSLYSDNACSTSALVQSDISSGSQVSLTGLSEGTHHYHFKTEGFLCSTNFWSYTLDATVPATPNIALRTSDGSLATPEVRVTNTTPGHIITIFADSTCDMQAVSNEVFATTRGDAVDIDVLPLSADGSYTFYAEAKDQAGNTSACSSGSGAYEYSAEEND